MKQYKVSGILVLSFVLLLGVLLPVKEAKAGKTMTVLNAESITDSTCWYCSNQDVLTDNNVLTFTDKSTGNTKFISKVTIEANEDYPEFLVAECLVKLNQLPQGEKFVLGLGLMRLEPSIGDANNIEITFTNDNGIKVGVYAYEKVNTPVTIVEPKACGVSIGQAVRVRVSITKDQVLNLTIGGKKICSKEIPVTGSGRVGFIQTGNCAVEIKGLDIKGYKYERPENTNVSEDFEKGVDISKIKIISTHESGVTLYKPGRVVVEEYEDGQNALMFVNAAGYYFTTKYQYSNFEMTFDVPYLRLGKEVYDEGGEGYFSSFGIAYGLTNDAAATWDSTDMADGIVFNEEGYVYSAKLEAFSTVLESHKFWEDFKPISVKLSVIDGEVIVGVKWVTESKYTTISTYQLAAGTPTGYIRFSIPEGGSGSIDNIKITNLDKNPNVIETEYKNGKVTFADAEYEPYERVYANELGDNAVVSTQKKSKMWYLLIPAALLVGGGIVGIPILTTKCKKKKVKEAKVNEV